MMDYERIIKEYLNKGDIKKVYLYLYQYIKSIILNRYKVNDFQLEEVAVNLTEYLLYRLLNEKVKFIGKLIERNFRDFLFKTVRKELPLNEELVQAKKTSFPSLLIEDIFHTINGVCRRIFPDKKDFYLVSTLTKFLLIKFLETKKFPIIKGYDEETILKIRLGFKLSLFEIERLLRDESGYM